MNGVSNLCFFLGINPGVGLLDHMVPQFLFYTVEPMGEHELGMVTIDSEIDQVSIFEGIDDKSLCRIFIL